MTPAPSLRTDESGTVLVFVAIALAVILGMVAMAFDTGRVASTQSELQSFADSVALASAAELDGRTDAIARATAAAAALVSDGQTFATGSQTLGAGDFALTFLSSLPASDTAAATATTTRPQDAIFVRVDVGQRIVPPVFAAAFAGLAGQPTPTGAVTASATAGFTQYACQVTPLMFCLPSPSWDAASHVGATINLRSGGQGAAWGPGDFGFLDPSMVPIDPQGPCAGLNGSRLDACLIGAIGSVSQCFAVRGVDTIPGQRVGIEDAIFNIRFDIYQSTMNGMRNNPAYAPAPNVIKGVMRQGGNGNGNGGSCIANTVQPTGNSGALPVDDCFAPGTCAAGNRFGDGVWSAGRSTYLSLNHDGSDPFPTARTRYQVYLAEIAAAGGGASRTPILASTSATPLPGYSATRWTRNGNGPVNVATETGRPSCSSQQDSSPDRRVIIAAGVDCTANPIAGRTSNVPVQEYFKIFLIQPVGTNGASPPTLDIWGEVVGSAGGVGSGSTGQAGLFRDVVQLYR